MAVNVKLIPVESSTASHVGYDESTREMTVVYHGGNTYQYFGISKAEYDSLFVEGISVGKQLKTIIKGKTYNKL